MEAKVIIGLLAREMICVMILNAVVDQGRGLLLEKVEDAASSRACRSQVKRQ